MSEQIRRIIAASTDGRAQNSYYIQTELKRLYDSLISAESSIKKATRSDFGYGSAEVDIEYYLTLNCVRAHYSSLDPAKELEDEYSLAKSVDQPSRATAIGCVYIVPSSHGILYSTIAPLSAAIAAGNCVIMELKQTLSELNGLLRQILKEALDADTFVVVESRPDDAELFSKCLIAQEDTDDNQSHPKRLSWTGSSRVVAIVDRTSNIEEAAREIVRARLAFGGRSAYAPDLVLVNEFSLKKFCNVAVQQATAHFAGQIDAMTNGNGSISRSARKVEKSISERDLSEGETETLVSASRGSVILVGKRNSRLMNRKITEPLVLIHAVSSLDDAIDFTNSSNETGLLANYVFGAPTATKYLSQFIDARMTCVNRIPVDLLVGPACPSDFISSIDSRTRFTKAMFSQPHPEYVQLPERSVLLAQALDGNTAGAGKSEALRKVRDESKMPLPDKKRQEFKNIGFFEQGLLTGVAVLATSVVASAAVVGIWVVPAVVRRLRR